ncbi:uncharacterized protein L3040_003528 [Drepanopeziza brunnea f. sp. 'multigermtubi']|uniref:uncharacterized protein n=1 Tax=Drepanopeziza brunnea f. sp. 'multigermtubi' TaxID=698441 RepID=UPI00239A1FB6|nr:hypothetical protein L3040_003528 [Drepanopeziza brunnea f. sp. 'multigermtubi']
MHSPTLVAALVVLLGFVTASPMVSPKVSSKLEPRQDMQFCILKGALTCGRAFNPRVGHICGHDYVIHKYGECAPGTHCVKISGRDGLFCAQGKSGPAPDEKIRRVQLTLWID